MNKIYSKIWNKARGCFVAVAEVVTANQRGGKTTVVLGCLASTIVSGVVNAASVSDYRENIPSGPITTKQLAIEGEYRLNWADTVTVTETGGLYTYIYNRVNSTLKNVNNAGQMYLGAWGNGGIYYLNSTQITNQATGQFHIGNYITKMVANGFSNAQNLQGTETTDAMQPERFELQGSGSILNNGQFFNRVEVRISDGLITNNGNWSNDGVINQNAGTVTGTGIFSVNGTYNLNGGSFSNKINGTGKFIVAGGNFYSPLISGNISLQVNGGKTGTLGNASGAALDNYGVVSLNAGHLNAATNRAGATFTAANGAYVASLDNYGTANLTNKIVNATNRGLLNSNGSTITGTLNNLGIANLDGIWSFSNGKLISSGTLKTDRTENIFSSLGTTGNLELNYVGLNSTEPQEVKTSLNEFFQKYLPGSVAQNLIDHATFTGGKVIVTGVNLTQTQAADLTKAFKSKFFLLPGVSISSFSQECRLKSLNSFL